MVCVDLVVQVSQASRSLKEIDNSHGKSQFLLFSSLESYGHFGPKDFLKENPQESHLQAKLACASISLLEQQLYYSLTSIASIRLCLQKQSELGLLCFKIEHDREDEKRQNDDGIRLYYEDAIVKSFIIGVDLLKKEYNEILRFVVKNTDGNDLTAGLDH